MRRRDRIALIALMCAPVIVGAADEEPLFNHRAAITIEQAAAFVKLPLPASAYAHTDHADLRDLRVVDAQGGRVPFALLAPRPDETRLEERLREATLYPLPPRPTGGAPWAAPVDVIVDGDRVTVRKRGAAAMPAGPSPGWLIDLGERMPGEPVPRSVRLQWSGPAEFSTTYAYEQSDDLRRWRAGGAGQVMAVASPAGALMQPTVTLVGAPARFLRLVWGDGSSAPRLIGAQAVTPVPRSVALDPPSELTVATSAVPAGKQPPDDDTRRALHFDLGAPLPLVQIDLQLGSGTQVVPARVQARDSPDRPWQPLAGAVFYRLDRGDGVAASPPLGVNRTARYLRIVPDARAATPDPAQVKLVARVALSSLVFAAQGRPPYALLAGSAHATTGALPLATLVPALDEERPRFGRASLGPWVEVTEAMRRAEAERRRAALRPWVLWAVLLVGVAGLGAMVWRLARSRPGVAS
jgi:hypothetical protein